jgi:hypothetical protein
LFRTQQPADEKSHVSNGSVCFFAVLVQNLFSLAIHTGDSLVAGVQFHYWKNIFFTTIKLQWLRKVAPLE